MKNPFRYFKTSPEIIRLAVTLYVRIPLSLRNVEDLLHERGIDAAEDLYPWYGPANSSQSVRFLTASGARAVINYGYCQLLSGISQ